MANLLKRNQTPIYDDNLTKSNAPSSITDRRIEK